MWKLRPGTMLMSISPRNRGNTDQVSQLVLEPWTLRQNSHAQIMLVHCAAVCIACTSGPMSCNCFIHHIQMKDVEMMTPQLLHSPQHNGVSRKLCWYMHAYIHMCIQNFHRFYGDNVLHQQFKVLNSKTHCCVVAAAYGSTLPRAPAALLAFRSRHRVTMCSARKMHWITSKLKVH